MLNPETLQQLRNKGLSWNAIAQRLDIDKTTLLRYRKKHNMPLEQKHHSTNNKKMCQVCRHKFLKKDLLLHKVWICKECYQNKRITPREEFNNRLL